MSDSRRILIIASIAYLSLFLVGAIEFVSKAAPGRAGISGDFYEVTAIVGIVYGILGAIGSVIIALFLLYLRRKGSRIRIDLSLFLLWALVAFVYTGYAINTEWLHGIPMNDPLSMIVTSLLLVACLAVFYILHRLLTPTILTSVFGKTTLGTIVFVLLFAHAGACAGELPSTTAADERGIASDLNLLLITVDTLRPDHLGCYGHEGIRTPVIDGLATSGILFENACSSIPITLPSHASIMTGLYPPTHGIRFNGAFALADSIVTLAEVLQDDGYSTAAVVASYALDSEFGLDQGFSSYDDSYPSGNILKFKYPELWPSLARLLLSRVLASVLPLDLFFSEPQRRANKVTGAGLNWLENHSGDRFFLWLHYFDPHSPYDPPENEGPGLPDTSVPDNSLVSRAPPYRYWWGELESLEEIYRLYDGEIEYSDRWIGRIVDELERVGIREKTLIVFAADHGESLWEHGLAGHGYSVYDSELKVPLIISLPGVLPAGSRVDKQVELIDLFPTILDILGVPRPQLLQGRNIVNMTDQEDPDGGRVAYSETLWPQKPQDRKKGLRTAGWKYVADPSGGHVALYHLTTDPHELHDLHEQEPDITRRFAEEMTEISSRLGDTNGDSLPEMNEDVKARLRALGYVR